MAYFNPFPGLRSFGINESHLFFGREGQSEEVLLSLTKHRFVAVVGASGSGKSSLMYCGIVPLIYGGFIRGAGTAWRMIVMRPGNSPINNLTLALTSSLDNSLNNSELEIQNRITNSILRSSSVGLIEALKHLHKPQKQSFLILIDQFEELFRYKKWRNDAGSFNESFAFVNLLIAAIANKNLPIYIVLTMRSDYIGECSQYQKLTALINKSHYLIPQMTRNNLRNAILGPVAVGGGKISNILVNQLLNDVADNPDHLPILQHALMRTWDFWLKHKKGDETIDLNHYDAIGRMEKALSEHANEAYSELSDDSKLICKTMFKSLTERGTDNRGIRHPTMLKDIAEIARAAETDVIEVVEKFRAKGRSFLTPASDIPIHSNTVIDISHESLMRIWDRLKIWVEEEANSVQIYLRLSEAAERYQLGETGLWRQPDLQLAINWRERQKPSLKWAMRYAPAFERTMVYLETSEKEYRAEELNRIKQQKTQLRRSRLFAIILGIATIISIGGMIFALSESQKASRQEIEAKRQSEYAKNQALIADNQRDEAKKQRQNAFAKEKEARREKERAERQKFVAEFNAQEAFQQSQLAERKTQEVEKQKLLAENNAAMALEQKKYALESGKEAYRLRLLSIAQSMAVKSIQINKKPDKKALISYQAYIFNQQNGGIFHNNDIYSGLYNTLKDFDGEKFNLLSAHKAAVRSMVYSKETQRLYSAGSDGRIFVWNLAKPETNSLFYKDKNINRSIDISRDGNKFAVANDAGEIKVFDLNNLNIKPLVLKESDKPVWKIRFSPNSRQILAAGSHRGILLWDITKENYTMFFDTEKTIRTFEVANDGKFVAAGTDNGELILINTQNKNVEYFYLEQNNSIYALAFNNAGSWIATGDMQGNLKIWDINNKKLLHNFEGHNARISDIQFSPNDSILASASFDGTVQLWLTSNFTNQPIILYDDNSWVLSLTFVNKGKELITGFRDNKIKRWATNTTALAEQVCMRISRNMSANEWIEYVAADIPYQKTCGRFPPGEGVDTLNLIFSNTQNSILTDVYLLQQNTEIEDYFDENYYSDDIFFGIQIFVSLTYIEPIPANFTNLENIDYYLDNGQYIYYCGREKTLYAALKLQQKIKNVGYLNTIAIAFKNNKRITIEEALKTVNIIEK